MIARRRLIAVTPIFSASYSGLFKSFFDVLDPDALAGKPVLIAATGGTARHSLVAGVRACGRCSPTCAPSSSRPAVFAASEDWASGGTSGQALGTRIDRAAGQLASLVVQQPPVQAPEPYADAPSFESLLAGG